MNRCLAAGLYIDLAKNDTSARVKAGPAMHWRRVRVANSPLAKLVHRRAPLRQECCRRQECVVAGAGGLRHAAQGRRTIKTERNCASRRQECVVAAGPVAAVAEL